MRNGGEIAATDGQTDRQTDGISRSIAPPPFVGCAKNLQHIQKSRFMAAFFVFCPLCISKYKMGPFDDEIRKPIQFS
jgi:hypothetical protein